MKIDVAEFTRRLTEADNILILTHEQPDGDALGCAYAMLRALRAIGKKSRVEYTGECPHNMEYILYCPSGDTFTPELTVAVDLADIKLLGENHKQYEGKIDLCLDHHSSNTGYAKYTLLREAAAASEIVLDVINLLGVKVDKYIASCIYTGISTDTGCFRYPNTTSHTLRVAADMIDAGIDVGEINKLMFETKTKSFVKLEKLANDSLELLCKGRCALISITRSMFDESGASECECHPITAASRQIEGVLVGAVIKEQRDGSFNVSIRTNGNLSAADICASMGGGGHKNAAGCELTGTLDEVKSLVIENITVALNKTCL